MFFKVPIGYPELILTDHMHMLPGFSDRLSGSEMDDILRDIYHNSFNKLTVTQHLYIIHKIMWGTEPAKASDLGMDYIDELVRSGNSSFVQVVYDVFLAEIDTTDDAESYTDYGVWVKFKEAFISVFGSVVFMEPEDFKITKPRGAILKNQIPIGHERFRFLGKLSVCNLTGTNPIACENKLELMTTVDELLDDTELWSKCNRYDKMYILFALMKKSLVSAAFEYTKHLDRMEVTAVYREYLNELDTWRRSTRKTRDFLNWFKLRSMMLNEYKFLSIQLPDVSEDVFNESGCRLYANHPLMTGLDKTTMGKKEYLNMLEHLATQKDIRMTIQDHMRVVWKLRRIWSTNRDGYVTYYTAKAPPGLMAKYKRRYPMMVE